VDDERLSADTLASMARPSDLDALFDTTLAAVVAGLLPTPEVTR
jgi:hypothetical protein